MFLIYLVCSFENFNVTGTLINAVEKAFCRLSQIWQDSKILIEPAKSFVCVLV